MQCIIKQAKDDQDQALTKAKQYTDLAEYRLVSRIEVVRDFWRNEIVEGNS